MIKAFLSAAAFAAAFFLSGCTTTVAFVPNECDIVVVEKPKAPEPVAIQWQVAHGIFYTDEDNFETYVRNLEDIIAYTADQSALLDYYIDAAQTCQEVR